MDTDLLKTFLEVQQTRHFGKAAENLYLTQAAVSARIKQLESSLGGSLFTRLRNNLQLTDTGKRLVPHAQSILIAWERARIEVALKDDQKTSIVVGATNGLWDFILKDQLTRLYSVFDEVVFHAESHTQNVLTRRLMERSLDLALVYEPAKIPDLSSVEVTCAELSLICSKPISNHEAAFTAGYVAVDWGTSFKVNYAKSFQGHAPPVMHTNQAKIALDFLLDRGGSAYLPLTMVEPYLGKVLFQYAEAPTILRPVYACYHKENRNEDLLKKMIKVIDKALD